MAKKQFLSLIHILARSCIAALIAQLDPTVDELADIRTAVSLSLIHI